MSATSFFRAATCAAALVLTACGGGGGGDGGGNPAQPPVPPPIPMIGPAGGMASDTNGAQVVVPAGALAANTAIVVDQFSAGSPALPSGMNAFGPLYAFTPHGTTFAAPVIALTDVIAIAFGTGLGHGLAVLGNGTVWSWGHNSAGQLGNGSTAPFTATPVQVTGLNLN
jgi:hypothetical protein